MIDILYNFPQKIHVSLQNIQVLLSKVFNTSWVFMKLSIAL